MSEVLMRWEDADEVYSKFLNSDLKCHTDSLTTKLSAK